LVPVDLKVQANMKAWATVDSSGTLRIAVINKDKISTGTIAITAPGYNKAAILRLRAPSFTATSGVTFGGQTFDGSPDGTIQGTQTSEVSYGSNGLFHIWMSATSAALVIFSK
jgi:glycosyl hydrolase family 79